MLAKQILSVTKVGVDERLSVQIEQIKREDYHLHGKAQGAMFVQCETLLSAFVRLLHLVPPLDTSLRVAQAFPISAHLSFNACLTDVLFATRAQLLERQNSACLGVPSNDFRVHDERSRLRGDVSVIHPIKR